MFVIAFLIAGGDYIKRDLGEADASVVSWRYWCVVAGLVVTFTAFFGALLSLLYSAMDRAKPDLFAEDAATADGASEAASRHRSRIPVAVSRFLVIVTCWLPYLLIRFPGNVDTDCQAQIAQFYGLWPRSDQHPWFDTLVFGAFWKIGDALGSNAWSVFLYAIVMIALTAAAFAVMLEWMRRLRIPLVFQRICLWFCALYPLIPLSVVTMSKETMYGPWFILFVTMIAQIARTRGASLSSWRFDAALAVCMLLMMLTKKTGAAVIVVTCVIVFFAIRRRQGLRLAAVLAVVLALFMGLWQGVVVPAMGVAPGQSREMMSIPVQFTGAYVRRYSSAMTDDDWRVLDGVLTDTESIADRYIPGRADPMKDSWRPDSTPEQRQAYFRWLFDKARQHPKLAAEAALSTGLSTYYPDTTRHGAQAYLWYRDYMCPQGATYEELHGQANEQGIVYDCSADPALWAVMHTTNKPVWAVKLSSAYNRAYLAVAKRFPVPFLKALFASWVPLMCLGYCLRRRSVTGAMTLVPAFVTFASLLASPSINVRYVLPSVYATSLNAVAGYIERESVEAAPEPGASAEEPSE